MERGREEKTTEHKDKSQEVRQRKVTNKEMTREYRRREGGNRIRKR